MIIIFSFSAKPAEESDGLSLTVGYTIGQMFVPGFEEWSIEAQEAFAERINYPVRKCAHAMEYTILGLFLAGTIVGGKRSRIEIDGTKRFEVRPAGYKYNCKLQFLLCLIIGAAYAASDEFHQLFVPGRAGKVTDVLIDSGGVIFGLLVAYVAWRLWKKWRCHKS